MKISLFRTYSPTQTRVWWALLLLLALRLVSLGLYPLMDNTEARGADIARVMLSLGDWVTPWYAHDVPFWGKPPLSFWATAFSLSVGGLNELSARLPNFLSALGVGFLVWGWARQRSKQEALAALALLGGCGLTLLAAGAVVPDMVLVLGTTLMMRGFWLALHGPLAQRKREGLMFFAGLGIGLLAAGPLVLGLAGLPLGLWVLLNRQWGQVGRQLPWWRGGWLVLLLLLPWYVLVEWRTPDFLNNFLMAEQGHRWAGGLYGRAQAVPWYPHWAYACLATLPWSLLWPLAWWFGRSTPVKTKDTRKAKAKARASAKAKAKTQAQSHAHAHTYPPPPSLLPPVAALNPAPLAALRCLPLPHYLLLWSLAPVVLLALVGHTLWAYALVAVPALALWGAAHVSQRYDDDRVNQWLVGGLVASTVLLAGAVLALNLKPLEDRYTTKALITAVNTLNTRSSVLLFYPTLPYSASFYTQGQAKTVTQVADIWLRLAWPQSFLAVKKSEEATLPPELRAQLHRLLERGDYVLFELGNHLATDAEPLLTPLFVAPTPFTPPAPLAPNAPRAP